MTTYKRITSIVLLALVVLTTQAATWTGTGVETDAYCITTEAQLDELANEVAAGNTFEGFYFELAANLTLTAASREPVGTLRTPFMGHFNGKGHTVANLNILLPERNCVGLFGCLKNAVVENLGILSGAITGNQCVGAVAGYAINSELRNCYNHAAVTGTAIVGGILGKGDAIEEEILGKRNGANKWSSVGYVAGASGNARTWINMGHMDYTGTKHNTDFPKTFDGGFSAYWEVASNSNVFELPQIGDNTYLFPMYFAIDLTDKASYSRMKVWMRDRTSLSPGNSFTANMMSVFEIWGNNTLKPASEIGDGSTTANQRYWTSWSQVDGEDAWKNEWVKVADCRLVLPSGRTKTTTANPGYPQLSDEDNAFILAGFDFYMEPAVTNQAFRYLRFQIHETNTDVNQIQIAEFKFFGKYETTAIDAGASAVRYCYNTGAVTATGSLGGIVDMLQADQLANNNYYLSTSVGENATTHGTPQTAAEMQTAAFVDALNTGNPAGEVWQAADDGGYPELIRSSLSVNNPGPAIGTFYYSGADESLYITSTSPATVAVRDLLGNTLLNVANAGSNISLSDIPAGVYIVTVQSDNQTKSLKIIKR
jgi:hypothetical protein